MMANLSDSMDQFSQIVITTLKLEILYSTILFVIILSLAYLLRNKSPYWQVGLWTLILIRLFLPPDLSFSYSARNFIEHYVIVDKAEPSAEKVLPMKVYHESPKKERIEESATVAAPVVSADPAPAPIKKAINVSLILTALWFFGVLVSLGLYLKRSWYFHHIIRKANVIRDGELSEILSKWRVNFKIGRKVQLVTSRKYRFPFTIGIVRPKVFIPQNLMDSVDLETLESIIAHEMVHIKRFDDLWIKFQNLSQILYFFNPVVWYVNSRLNLARESICDDMVISKLEIAPSEYCRSILNVLKMNLLNVSIPEPVSSFADQKKNLEYRIKHIMRGGIMKNQNIFFVFIVIALISIFALPMAISKPQINSGTELAMAAAQFPFESSFDEMLADETTISNSDHLPYLEETGDLADLDSEEEESGATSEEDEHKQEVVTKKGNKIIIVGDEGEEVTIDKESGKITIRTKDGEVLGLDGLEGLEHLDHLGDLDHLDHLDHLEDLDHLGHIDGMKEWKWHSSDHNEHKFDWSFKKDYTPLMKAALKGDLDKARALIDEGAEVNATNNHNSTALTLAAEFGHTEIVKLLLKKGADINASDDDGDSPLILALMKDHIEIADLLLKKGADIHVKNDKGWTTLMCAARAGNLDAAKTLLNKGLDVNASSKHNSTPLTLAAEYGQTEMVKLLLDKRADVNAKDNDDDSPLLLAAMGDHQDIAKMLLKKGADVNVSNDHNSTPLTIAAEFNHTELVKLLLDKKADINAKDNDGDSALLLAVMKSDKEIVEMLLKKGADVHIKNDDGWTPLMCAAEVGDLELVTRFAKAGLKIDEKKDSGATPLMLAANEGHQEVVDYLLRSGANVNEVQKFKRTALMYAALNGHTEVSKTLIKNGANVNLADKHQSTALTLSAEKGYTEIVKLLIKNGADVDAEDEDGDSSLEMARRRGHKGIVRLLTEAGAKDES